MRPPAILVLHVRPGGGGSASTKSTKLVAAFNGLYMCLCDMYILCPHSMVNTDADEGLRVIV